MSGKTGRNGRKRKISKKIQHNTSVDLEMYSRIEEIARSHRWTVSSALGYLVELGLENYKKEIAI